MGIGSIGLRVKLTIGETLLVLLIALGLTLRHFLVSRLKKLGLS